MYHQVAGVGERPQHAGRDIGSMSQKHLHTSWSAWNIDPKNTSAKQTQTILWLHQAQAQEYNLLIVFR